MRRALPTLCTLASIVSLLCASNARAQTTILDVQALEQSLQRHPKFQAQTQDVAGAQARKRQAQGAFNTAIKAKGYWHPYLKDYTYADAAVIQPLAFWGTDVVVGWRTGVGELPPYKGAMQSANLAGEVYVGLNIPLWGGRAMDARRTSRRVAQVGLQIAELGQTQLLMELQLDAAKAYTSWLASGWILTMEQQRLVLLEQRQTGLKARMDAGDFSRLEFLDASRQYKEQKAQVLAAQQDFFAASAKLGQYWRDEDGLVQSIPNTMLPARFHAPIVATAWTQKSLERVLKAQPKVRILGLKRQALNMKIALAQEQIRPQLSFAPEFIQTLGEGAFDTKQKENELALGVNFMMYLGQDKARGKLQELQAKRASTRLKQRQAQDVVRVKLITHLNALQLALPRFELRKEAMELAIQVAAMEREKLDLGAQDIFKVNAREEKAIDAQIKTIKLYKDVLYHQMALDIMTRGQTP